MSSKLGQLQTTKANALTNPLQRHSANKAMLQQFYAHIQEGIEGQFKIRALHQPKFNECYLKPKYWFACRFKSNEENSEEQLIRIKVSNKQFCEVTIDNKEVALDLKSTWAVVAQNKTDYTYFTETLNLCKQIESDYEAENNMVYKEEIHRYRQRSEAYFGLFTKWHIQPATLRLCVLVKDKLDKDKMLFIYNKESSACPQIQQSKVNSSVFDSKKEDHIYQQEIIKVHHCKQMFEKDLTAYKNYFLKTIKASFATKIQNALEQEKRVLAGVLGNERLANAFKKYDLNQSQNLLIRWKNQSSKLLKNKRLFIQVLSIWINKSKIPKNIVLSLRSLNKEGKEQILRKQYFYKTFEGQYGIYELQTQQVVRCLSFQIQKAAFSKQIFIEVEVTYQNGKAVKFKNTFTHFKLEGKDAFTHQLNLYPSIAENEEKETDCFIFLKTKESRVQSLNSIIDYHHRIVFEQVGHIPTKYRSSLLIDYNPTTYSIVRQLLLRDTPEKISKVSYQQGYLTLVQFIQQQQNNSQLLVANLHQNKIINKCPMKQRLVFYQKQVLKNITQPQNSSNVSLSNSATIPQQKLLAAYLNSIDPRMLQILGGKQFSISLLQYKNLIQDLNHYKPLNQELVKQSLIKYIFFVNKISCLKEFPYSLRYISNLVPILEKYLTILFNSKASNEEESINNEKYTVRFFVFILVIAKIYPYCDSQCLKKDLLIIRSLVSQHLPFYNASLNRLHIGLQNVISTHLLNLFTDLSEELTFRIWDFLISSQNTAKARLVVAFTLLTYFQTTKNLPIIPINQFMTKVQQNYSKLVIQESLLKESKSVQIYFASQEKKAKRLERLIKDNRKSVADDKYIQRIVLGQTFIKEEAQQRIRAQYEPNKVVQLIKQLSYPLPRPNYFGKPVVELTFFVHNLNILENLNLVAQKYSLRFTCPLAKQKQAHSLFIASKNYFYNESFKFTFDPLKEKAIEQEDLRVLVIQVLQLSGQKVELSGKLNFSHFQKDRAYKTLVTLAPKSKHNKGQTVISLSFCLKSNSFNTKLQSKSFTNLQQFSYSLLDYQIGQLNESMHKLNDLNDQLQQIKSPLDEFEANQNKRIQNSVINYFENQWLQNSKTSIQELKTIFYHIFPQEKDKDLKLEFSKIYQIFSEEQNMQSIYLTEVLTRLILATSITRKKKLTYLYCLGVHYQNSYSKKLTSQTVNSILRLILKQREIISACPYEIETCGQIIEAYFFSSSLKNLDEKTYFTEIIQDWLYICTFKFGYCGLILGTSHNLSILKSLFDVSTLRRIENQPECRFEIVYELNGSKYIWSVVIESKSFNILKRGTKFLNSFDGYGELKYLDSTQEYLYNCENVIPLQVHKGYSYAEFTKIMLENQLVKYALQIPPINSNQEKTERCILKDVLEDSRSSNFFAADNDDILNKKVIEQPEDEGYESWVLHRSHNCLQNWRKCSIVSPGPILSEVKYRDDPEIYTVSTIDLISMDEISVSELQKQQL